VRDVKVLERFAFVSVPTDEADRIVGELDGSTVKGVKIALAPANK